MIPLGTSIHVVSMHVSLVSMHVTRIHVVTFLWKEVIGIH